MIKHRVPAGILLPDDGKHTVFTFELAEIDPLSCSRAISFLRFLLLNCSCLNSFFRRKVFWTAVDPVRRWAPIKIVFTIHILVDLSTVTSFFILSL